MTDLATLLDIRAIEQGYYRYCEVIDAKQFAALADVFEAGAVQDYRSSNGILQNGLAPLVERLERNMGAGSYCGGTQHNVTNIRIVVDGDTATAKAHFYAVHAGVEAYEGQRYTCWGEYGDVWARGADGWRVRRRDYRNFLTEGPVAIIRGKPVGD
jgi:ketosteroid isomerase-like protein